MASNRSYKSTRNPTLRGYTRKTEGEQGERGGGVLIRGRSLEWAVLNPGSID